MAGPSPSQGEGPSRDESSPGARARQGLSRDQKVRRRADYLRCYRQGRRRHGSLATIHFHPNRERDPRLGITASRKVGKAVVRQRAKRRVREIFRRWSGRLALARLDIVVHLKPSVAHAAFSDLEAELERMFATLPSRNRSKTGDAERTGNAKVHRAHSRHALSE